MIHTGSPLTSLLILFSGLILALSGCDQFSSPPLNGDQQPARSPAMSRLMAANPEDLANGRFVILADFEEPLQASLFYREPDQDPEAIAISAEQSVPETGDQSLRISLNNVSQRIVYTDTAEGDTAFQRDWSPYNLLLFNIFSPRDLPGFRFSVRSGQRSPLIYTHPRIFLKSGWNQVRVDLGEVAENVYLGDVRDMRFWCDPLDTPIDLYLDNLILTDNARLLFGKPHPGAGELYVEAQGRRLVVGVSERFVLAFIRGRIRQWFDLTADPVQIHDLSGIGSLGPSPMLIPADQEPAVALDDPSQWSALGLQVEAHQTLIEANPLQVVLQGEWRFGSADRPIGPSSPRHRWIYTIYRDGRIYVECSGSGLNPALDSGEIGLAFSCDGHRGFERIVVDQNTHAEMLTGSESGATMPPFAFFSRPAGDQSDFLVVPFRPLSVQLLENPIDPRLAVLFRQPVQGGQFFFAGMMRIWPTDLDTVSLATAMAIDYTHPLPIDIRTGRLVGTDLGDVDGDGFSEAHGYYVVQLDGRVATIRLNAQQHLRFSPNFKLVDLADQEVWVYVNGRQLKNTQRDANGDVLFQVPGVVSQETLIEIIAGETPAAAGGDRAE